VLVYSTYLGGTGHDEMEGIAVDAAGNAYVTGHTCCTGLNSNTFPTTPGAFDTTFDPIGEWDVFVTKLNPSGSAFVYSTVLGGDQGGSTTTFAGRDRGRSIAVDAAGSAYVTGFTRSPDFPTTPAAFDRTCGGLDSRCDNSQDVFVTKLNPAGNDLAYSTFLGGGGFEDSSSIAVDSSGNAYVAGRIGSSTAIRFPTTPGAFDTTTDGGDCFVTKLNPSGTGLVYSTFLGGGPTNFRGGNDEPTGIAVDAAGNAYVTGFTDSRDFPTTPGAFDRTCGTDGRCNSELLDAFVTKLNAAGSDLLSSTYLGGSGTDYAVGISVDAAGNAYVSGFGSRDFPADNPLRVPDSTLGYAFVMKLNPTGSAPVYSTRGVGGEIAVDSAGNAYLAGYSDLTAILKDPIQGTQGGGTCRLSGADVPCPDAYIAKLNQAGNELVYATLLGGNREEGPFQSEAGGGGAGIAVDAAGSVYVTGNTRSSNFPTKSPAPPPAQPNYSGFGYDGFIAKISDGQPAPPAAPATARVDSATKTCVPTEAYMRIPPQPAAGPNFPAIPEQPPTQIKCTFEGEVVLDGSSGNIGPVNLTIFDGFSPGLFFNTLTASNPPLTVDNYTNNVLTFKPIQLALSPGMALQTFKISFSYFAFLNDLAEQRTPQQNCITLRFTDPQTGGVILERGDICANTGVLVPRLSLEKYGSPTTGLPGRRLVSWVWIRLMCSFHGASSGAEK